MKTVNRYPRLLTLLATAAMIFTISGSALAMDDGARAYWNGREGANVVIFQYLNWDIQASGTQQFDPSHYIYPNSVIEARVFTAAWARHMTLFKRASSFAINIAGGSVGADVDVSTSGVLPPSVDDSFSQSTAGFGDPGLQFVINLYGTRQLKSNVDLLNYEPGLTIDAAVLAALPIGEYDDDKLVNMGLNRLWGRIALPIKYHFGVFSPGYMSSFELIPSVWLFAENDEFVGQKLENDPLLQIEAHLTHDFTPTFFGSLDVLYRSGFQSKIDGVEVGDELDVGNVGFTFNSQVTDNFTMRTGYSSNVFGDEDLHNSIIRIQCVYAWHTANENAKKLNQGH
jgi:hypothetical protein